MILWAKPIGVNNSSKLSGIILINLFLDSDHSYHWECNKVKEGKLLIEKAYWVIAFPVLGLGQGLGSVLVHML